MYAKLQCMLLPQPFFHSHPSVPRAKGIVPRMQCVHLHVPPTLIFLRLVQESVVERILHHAMQWRFKHIAAILARLKQGCFWPRWRIPLPPPGWRLLALSVRGIEGAQAVALDTGTARIQGHIPPLEWRTPKNDPVSEHKAVMRRRESRARQPNRGWREVLWMANSGHRPHTAQTFRPTFLLLFTLNLAAAAAAITKLDPMLITFPAWMKVPCTISCVSGGVRESEQATVRAASLHTLRPTVSCVYSCGGNRRENLTC